MRSLTLFVFFFFTTAMGVYSQCGACEYLTDNLVNNGDFSQGNTAFSTEYSLATTAGPWGLLSNAGTYVVGNNAATFHQFFAGLDHTSPGSGNYMIVNGSNNGGTLVWCQTINVEPNTLYSFSAWARNVDTNPQNTVYANLQFLVNGVALGNPFEVPGNWQNFSSDWDSGANTTVEICLVNQQTNGGGNDFGVDDITFTACLPYIIEMPPSAGSDVEVCHGEDVQIGEGSLTNWDYNWSNGTNLSSTTNSQPTFSGVNLTNAPIVESIILTTDSLNLGCVFTDTVNVTINPLPDLDLGTDHILCAGDQLTLLASGTFDEVSWENNAPATDLLVTTEGTYSATATLGACEITETVDVITPQFPNLNLGPDTSICEDQTITFGNGVAGTWNTQENSGFIEVSNEGWYWQELEEMGCTVRDSVFLEVINYPQVSLGDDFFLCPDTAFLFQLSQPGQWNTGEITDEYLID
ncbi:MAG: hypothetical protein HRT74_08735, partial [Flavobacteriales bacterium]|nr:hypothetical protein [Flavobacteriales bacterium]